MQALRAVAWLALTLSAGCSNALFSWTHVRSHSAFTDESYEAFRELKAAGPVTKADVLSTLGPPLHVVGQETGDVFVYRRRARDTRTVNLNPSFISFAGPAPPIPIYYGSSISGYTDTLMVFFDPQGRMLDEGQRFEIEGIGQALFGVDGRSRDR